VDLAVTLLLGHTNNFDDDDDDARSAKRGIAIVSRPSVCTSVRLWPYRGRMCREFEINYTNN